MLKLLNRFFYLYLHAFDDSDLHIKVPKNDVELFITLGIIK